jgi:ankyrin repeat protein
MFFFYIKIGPINIIMDSHSLMARIKHNSLTPAYLIAWLRTENSINVTNPDGRTGLQLACWHGFSRIASLLCKHEADVTMRTSDGFNALDMAAQNKYTGCIKILLDANADIEASNSHGCTALIRTAQSCQTDMVRTLLDAKANPNTADEKGQTALHVAVLSRLCYNGCVVELLAHGCNADLITCQGETALMQTVEQPESNLETVRRLLIASGNVNIKRHTGDSALMIAAQFGSCKLVQLLVEYKCDVHAQNNEGTTALIYASNRPDGGKMVKLLLANDCDANTITNNGITALHAAVGFNNTKAVRALIRRGRADVQHVRTLCEENKSTTLHPMHGIVTHLTTGLPPPELYKELQRGGCAFCQNTGKLLKCARCVVVWYCCQKCQRSHWRIHKKTCVKRGNPLEPPPTSA